PRAASEGRVRGWPAAGASRHSQRTGPVLRRMLLLAFGRERAPRDGVSERRAIPSPVGGRFLLIEKCILAFGRERAPRGGVSERRAIPSPVSGRFLLREECFWPSAANERREPGCPRGGSCRASKRAIPVERRMLFFAFGRERAPRGGVSERRAI